MGKSEESWRKIDQFTYSINPDFMVRRHEILLSKKKGGGDQTFSVNRYNYSHIFWAVSVFAQKRIQRCRKSLKLLGFDDRCSLKWRKIDTAVKKGDDTPDWETVKHPEHLKWPKVAQAVNNKWQICTMVSKSWYRKDSLEDIKKREQITRDFYCDWKERNPSQQKFNLSWRRTLEKVQDCVTAISSE